MKKKLFFLPLLMVLLLASCEKDSVSPAALEANQELDFRAPLDCAACTARGKASVAFVNGKGVLKYICIDKADAQDHKNSGHAVDEDGDCYYHIAGPWGDVDCNDDPNNGGAAINPGAAESSCNGVDDDCNSDTPDSSEEICDNGIDDDCDGLIDEDDSDCSTSSLLCALDTEGLFAPENWFAVFRGTNSSGNASYRILVKWNCSNHCEGPFNYPWGLDSYDGWIDVFDTVCIRYDRCSNTSSRGDYPDGGALAAADAELAEQGISGSSGFGWSQPKTVCP